MKVWKLLSEDEENEYLKKREWSPLKEAMPVGEKVEVDGKIVFIHHIDDQEGWFRDAQLHPLFKPGEKPSADEWKCDFKHTYEQ